MKIASVLISSVLIVLLGYAALRGLIHMAPWAPSPTSAPEQTATTTLSTPTSLVINPSTSTTLLYPYLEIVDSCGPYWEGVCVNLRAGPGTEYPVVGKLRNGVVLRISSTAYRDGREWYKIAVDENIRYPERVWSDWYVAADLVRTFYDDGEHQIAAESESPTTSKKIIVDRSSQMLEAYDGDTLFLGTRISTGLEFTPTPRGTFTIFKMTPSRYMQGPLLNISDDHYDLPGVPWNLYFTAEGAVIHGAYWHDKFGQRWSHGCVNLALEDAKKLYYWADIGTKVIVRD